MASKLYPCVPFLFLLGGLPLPLWRPFLLWPALLNCCASTDWFAYWFIFAFLLSYCRNFLVGLPICGQVLGHLSPQNLAGGWLPPVLQQHLWKVLQCLLHSQNLSFLRTNPLIHLQSNSESYIACFPDLASSRPSASAMYIKVMLLNTNYHMLEVQHLGASRALWRTNGSQTQGKSLRNPCLKILAPFLGILFRSCRSG